MIEGRVDPDGEHVRITISTANAIPRIIVVETVHLPALADLFQKLREHVAVFGKVAR